MELMYEHPIWTLIFMMTIGFWLAVVAGELGKRRKG